MNKFLKSKIKNFNVKLFLIKYFNLSIFYVDELKIKVVKKYFIKKIITGGELSKVVDILNINFFDWDGNELYRGGAERYVFDLACLIKRSGFTPRIIQNANFYFEKDYYGIKILGIPAKSGWNFKKLFVYYLNYFEGSDKVICSPLDIACVSSDKKIVGINHGIHWDGVSNVHYLANNNHKGLLKAMKNVNCGVCVDTNFMNWMRTLDRKLSNKLMYIPNYYDEKQFFYKDKKFDNNNIVITYPRRIYPQRGSRLVFGVLDSLFSKYENIIFHFVGQAHDEDRVLLEKYMKKYPGKVRWSVLDMDKMGSVYHESQIILIPTVASEGTSLSCIEAMATNNAVIATNIGGLPNLIIDDFNGLLIGPNKKELGIAIEELIINKEKRINLAKNAYEVARVFEKNKWEEKWLCVLNDFLVK